MNHHQNILLWYFSGIQVDKGFDQFKLFTDIALVFQDTNKSPSMQMKHYTTDRVIWRSREGLEIWKIIFSCSWINFRNCHTNSKDKNYFFTVLFQIKNCCGYIVLPQASFLHPAFCVLGFVLAVLGPGLTFCNEHDVKTIWKWHGAGLLLKRHPVDHDSAEDRAKCHCAIL